MGELFVNVGRHPILNGHVPQLHGFPDLVASLNVIDVYVVNCLEVYRLFLQFILVGGAKKRFLFICITIKNIDIRNIVGEKSIEFSFDNSYSASAFA